MESFQERYERIERERQEELAKYKLEQQLKIKKMTKLIGGSIVGLFLMVFLFKSCERIDAGHVGVKVNLYGDDKSSNNKSVYKYTLGDVIWVKPDSLKATISNKYYYGAIENGDNGVRYEIEYFGPNGHKETETIKEFQIFSKKY